MEDCSTTTTTTLKRRNSLPSAVLIPITNVNVNVNVNDHHHHFHSAVEFELLPLPTASYTSLKDILLPPSPSSVLSPTPIVSFSSTTNGGSSYEITIRNRLVKQAAWAYLQSAVASKPSSARRLCISGDFFRKIFAGFRHYVVDTVRCVYDWLVDALWLLLCR